MKNELPPAAMMMSHTVADWAKWKAVFDAQTDARKANGFLGHQINRGVDDENWISTYTAIDNIRAAQALIEDPDLHAAMDAAGITSTPEITWLTPVLQEAIWRPMPAMIVSYTVANFDAWFTGYKIAGEMQAAHGIVGHTANHVLGNPNQIVLYQQAASHETLKAFIANPKLTQSLERSGATSAPTVVYTHGGWAKTY